mmetsp:Transcript_19528/g.35711  ORF Transcript_19528/g.35711 Transcript_19528/m.35711 type:complete len:134 (+) Transcript_19528:810-1211(+)
MKLNKLQDLPSLLNQLTTVRVPQIFPSPKQVFISSFDITHHTSNKRAKHLNKTQIVMPTHDIGLEAFSGTEKRRKQKKNVRHRTLSMSFGKPISPREQRSFQFERPSSSRSYKNPLIKVATPTGAYCQYSKKL